MANVFYNGFKGKIGTIDWASAGVDVKAMLVADTYTPDIDADVYISDVTGEVSGTGYTAGGQSLANKAVVVDTANDVAKYDADDVTWTGTTITARGAVLYVDTGTPTTSDLICYIDFASNKTTSAGDFVIQWNADGVFKLA